MEKMVTLLEAQKLRTDKETIDILEKQNQELCTRVHERRKRVIELKQEVKDHKEALDSLIKEIHRLDKIIGNSSSTEDK